MRRHRRRDLIAPYDRPIIGRFFSVGVFAVADADDFDGTVTGHTLDEAPGTDAEAEQRRIEAFKLFDVSRTSVQKAVQRL